MGRVLPLCRGAVGLFYNPSRLGKLSKRMARSLLKCSEAFEFNFKPLNVWKKHYGSFSIIEPEFDLRPHLPLDLLNQGTKTVREVTNKLAADEGSNGTFVAHLFF